MHLHYESDLVYQICKRAHEFTTHAQIYSDVPKVVGYQSRPAHETMNISHS